MERQSWIWLGVIFVLLAGGAEARARELPPRYLVKFRHQISEDLARSRLKEFGLVEKRQIPELGIRVAEPTDAQEFEKRGRGKLEALPELLYVERNREVRATAVPNDPLYPQQAEQRRLEIEDAWDVDTGSSQVVVAVSDTGVSMAHPDLAAQIWTNTGEIAGDGLDNDLNGFVDDVHGWDFAANDGVPEDENRHGTHVAGIIGAVGNNGLGVAGVSWKVRIMPVRFLDANGSGSTENGIDTILYATRNGARVINASWGGGGTSKALKDAVDYAFARGTLLIAAAGNDGRNTDTQPNFPSGVDSPGVVAVASSAGDGELSSFSNYGVLSVDLAAPGSNILSTLPGGSYGRLSGTSMATPMASGVAALVLSKLPGLSGLELRNALLNAVIPRAPYSMTISTGGDLSASRALRQLYAGFQVWPAHVTLEVGREFAFSAYNAQVPVSWSTSDPKIATVNAEGTLHGVAAGEVVVSAVDASGQIAATQSVVIRKSEGSGPPTGCHLRPRRKGDPEPSLPETLGSIASLGLPVMVGLWVRRRRVTPPVATDRFPAEE